MLTYVEAGAGVGVVPDSMAFLDTAKRLVFKPLHPSLTVDLVMVWSDEQNNPVSTAFRALMLEWLRKDRLWKQGRAA